MRGAWSAACPRRSRSSGRPARSRASTCRRSAGPTTATIPERNALGFGSVTASAGTRAGSSSPSRPSRALPLDVLGRPPARRPRPNSASTWRQPPHGGVGPVASGHDRHGLDPALASHDHGGDGVALRADRERIARVLDVDADEGHGPRPAWPRRPRTRCTARTRRSRASRAAATRPSSDVVADRPAHSPGHLRPRWPSGSRLHRDQHLRDRGGPGPPRRVNVRPWNVHLLAALGDPCRTGRASAPPTVSHSSSGSSTSRSSFTSSIEALPLTR